MEDWYILNNQTIQYRYFRTTNRTFLIMILKFIQEVETKKSSHLLVHYPNAQIYQGWATAGVPHQEPGIHPKSPM